MTSKEDLFAKIRMSLDKARETLKMKDRIDSEIISLLEELRSMVDGKLTYEIKDFDDESGFGSSEKIVHISKSGMLFGPSFVLFGFSANEETGYPVQVETPQNLYSCRDESILIQCITEIISTENNSIKIVSLSSDDGYIPF